MEAKRTRVYLEQELWIQHKIIWLIILFFLLGQEVSVANPQNAHGQAEVEALVNNVDVLICLVRVVSPILFVAHHDHVGRKSPQTTHVHDVSSARVQRWAGGGSAKGFDSVVFKPLHRVGFGRHECSG